MNRSIPPPNPTLLEFTPTELLTHYPNIPIWAITAFFVIQRPQQLWTPEARALLNMACIPPTCHSVNDFSLSVPTLRGDLKKPFATEEDCGKVKEEVDLWRLSRDLIAAKKEGWGQRKGKVDRL